MNVGEWIRHAAFWGYDFSKGSPVARHIKDLEQAFANPQQSQQLADKRLVDILDHACSTTAFYKQFANKNFDEFPVIQKKTIKNNYDDFLSSSYDTWVFQAPTRTS